MRGMGLAVLAVVVLGACHEPANTHPVQATAVVDAELLDFGSVPVGEWRQARVHVRNVGYVPFSALEALGLSGNPSFHVQLEGPERLLPGEERVVLVRFHPLREGPLEEQLRVRTDANTGREHHVRVLGLGLPTPVRVHPERLDFETLEVDSERVLRFTLTNPVDLPLSVQVVGHGAFSTDTVGVPPLSTVEVEARYLPRTLGPMQARVQVHACAGCTPTVAELAGRSVPHAFEFDPAPVPFEPIPVHERTRSTTRVRNITWRPVSLSHLSTSDQSFIPLGQPSERVVRPGEVVEVGVEFAASYSGPATGTLTVEYQSDRQRQAQVALDASGGWPRLAVAPVALDFGELPVGSKAELRLRLSNAGARGTVHLLGVRGSGAVEYFSVGPPRRGTQELPWAPGSAWPELRSPPAPMEAGGEPLELSVYFEPTTVGAWQATLTLLSDDRFNPERTVVLTGRSRTSGPCSFLLLPQPELDFGNLPPGRGAVLGFHFINTGRTECTVKDIHVSQSAGGAFFMPGGTITGGGVPWASAFSAMVAFRPPTAGEYTGELQLTVNEPRHPVVRLPLRGSSRTSCLVASPPFVDFGPVRYDCAPPPRRTLVSNQCPTPTTLLEARIGSGTSDQFTLSTPLAGPRVLAPGEGVELEVHYARDVLGQHYSPLLLSAEGEPRPLLVPLLAETNHEGLQVDRFTQGAHGQLDVLFVVGNTTTLAPYQRRLAEALPAWLEQARQAGVELQVGTTTTGLVPRNASCGGGALGGEAGRLFPVDGSSARIVSSTWPQADALLQANVQPGTCHNLVQGLEALRQALSEPLIRSADDPRTPQPGDGNAGLLRDTAPLAVVVVADEDDHSGFEPDSYVQFLQALKGPGMAHRTRLHALVPVDSRCTTAAPSGLRFATVAHATGGQVDSVCLGDYGPFLQGLLSGLEGPQAEFPLLATPTSLAGMAVSVDGLPLPPGTWSYLPERNALLFSAGSVPRAGQSVEVRYRSTCPAPPRLPP